MHHETPTQRRARIVEETRQELAIVETINQTVINQMSGLQCILDKHETESEDSFIFGISAAAFYQHTINARAEMVRQITDLLTLVNDLDNKHHERQTNH